MGGVLTLLMVMLAAGAPAKGPSRPPAAARAAPASPAPAAPPPGVVVVPRSTSIKGGEAAQLEISNRRDGAVHLPACGMVTLAQFDGQEWTELPMEPCRAEAPAEMLGAGGSRGISVPVDLEGRHILRVGVTYGVDCRPGLPLDQAECRAIETRWSRFFSWTSAAVADP